METKILKKLNSKHEAFIEAYFNGTDKGKAFNSAFGDDENSEKKAAKLLAQPLIQKRLRMMQDEALEKERLSVFKTRERIIRELESVAFADIKDFYPFLEGMEDEEAPSLDSIPREKRGAIASVTKGKGGITLKLNDKFKAIELLEKELASLEGKQEEKGDEDIKVSIKVC